MLFGAILRPFSGFEETVDLFALCFDAIFANFVIFDDFGHF